MRLAPPHDMGLYVVGVLAIGLVLLVALDYPLVETIDRLAGAWSRSASDDRPASNQGAGSAPSTGEESVTVRPADSTGLDTR
jgi:hypothetical protein